MDEQISKSLDFARRIAESIPQPTGPLTAETFRNQYLYTQCYGALYTAESYWLLRKASRFHDCQVLARNLLERIANSRVAVGSPSDAIDLIGAELEEYIRTVNLVSATTPEQTAAQDKVRADRQADLAHFTALRPAGAASKVNLFKQYFERFKAAGLEGFYRTAYWHLSGFAHANYRTARKEDYNQAPIGAVDLIALITPPDTAIHWHRAETGCGGCDFEAEYTALLTEFTQVTMGS